MIALFLLLADCSATSLPAGAHHFTLDTREYDIIVPKATMLKNGFPVVIALHGAGSSPAEFNATTRLPEVAGRDPFVLVLPVGIGKTWNAGACCGEAKKNGADDVAFVKQLLDRVAEHTCVDPSRMFAVGHSDGAAMVHRLACELSDRLAAVAAVSGGPADETTDGKRLFECKPKRRIPFLQVHGSADGCYPEKGGVAPSTDGPLKRKSIGDMMNGWRERNGCGERMRVIHKVGAATCKVYDGCPDHADVVSCRLEDGGHGWPGAASDVNKGMCGGTQVTTFSASEFIWAFFRDHPLPAPSSVNVGLPAQDMDVILRGGKPQR